MESPFINFPIPEMETYPEGNEINKDVMLKSPFLDVEEMDRGLREEMELEEEEMLNEEEMEFDFHESEEEGVDENNKFVEGVDWVEDQNELEIDEDEDAAANDEETENIDPSFKEEENILDEQTDFGEADGYVISKEMAEVIEQQVTETKSLSAIAKSCMGHTCWAKTILNQQLGVSLKVDNHLDAPMKKALGNFQAKNKLLQTQLVDFATERALLESDALRRHQKLLSKAAAFAVISAAKARIEDWTKMAINNKRKLILNSYRDPRKINALVLHQMALKRKNRKTGKFSDPNSYLSTGAHFCIMFDGRIIQLHPLSRMIWHAQCISRNSVAVEFEGHFPDVSGKWWFDKKIKIQHNDKLTQAQIDSGRFLVSYLKIVLGITDILAHRQSSGKPNDPGPDIWYYVAQKWAIDTLHLKDGGPGFKCKAGKPILPQWRTWGIGKSPSVYNEQNEFIQEREWEEDDNERVREEVQEDESERDEQDIGDEHYSLSGEDDFSRNEIGEFPDSRDDSEGFTSPLESGCANGKEIEERWEDEIDKDEQVEGDDIEKNDVPEFENFSLSISSYKLNKIKDWIPLLVFKVPADIVSKLRLRNMYVQYAHTAPYSNDLNVDFYRLRIYKFPRLNGFVLTPESLIKYIRLNINRFVDTSLCDFFPYDPVIDKPVWNSDNPTMAVLKLNIEGPDNASVVVSLSKPRGWRFTTIKSPNMGSHPVSGHREFFIGTDRVTRGTYFIIKGLDMMSSGVAGLGLPIGAAWGFWRADALWKSMRSKVIQFINSNGGIAKEDLTYSERVGWRHVYHSYKNLLANTFGKGAGSAANSSFIN